MEILRQQDVAQFGADARRSLLQFADRGIGRAAGLGDALQATADRFDALALGLGPLTAESVRCAASPDLWTIHSSRPRTSGRS